MGSEARKTNLHRGPDFIRRWFCGRVLDIGCGDDPVIPQAEPFDRAQGDARRILETLSPESYDVVHSSHCLEHMDDVEDALRQWWALVRPGGTMILVVPDEILYEQGTWPSIFNLEHRASFRLGGATSPLPASFELRQLLMGLPDAEIVDIAVQDAGYDHSLRRRIGPFQRRLYRFSVWRAAAMRRFLGDHRATTLSDLLLYRVERLLGRPVDQTGEHGRAALAQIQAIIRKGKPLSASTA
jgi:SAM-dependent methyltransferase